MTVQAFSLSKSRVDRISFCFNPPQEESEIDQQKYCRPDQIRRGIEWAIALELEKKPELTGKITFLKRHPAKNPKAGLFGLGASIFFLTSMAVFRSGTSKMKNDLDVFIGLKQKEIIIKEAERQKDLSLRLQQIAQSQEFISDDLQRQHSSMMISSMGEGEIKQIIKERDQNERIKDEMHSLQIQEIEKLQEKEQTEKLRLLKEQEKLANSKKSNDDSDDFDLEDEMKMHEGGWLWDLVAPNQFIILYGKPGSAKSYTAASIAIAQSIIHGSRLESIADPDYHQNKDKAWEHLKKLEPSVAGENKNWASYGDCIDVIFQSYSTRTQKDEPVSHIWDEIMLVRKELPERSDRFMPTMVASPRKANSSEICITHSLTTEGLPGSDKIMESIKESSIRLKLKANARKEPLFKGVIGGWIDSQGNEIEDMEVTIPEWFRPDQLIKIWEKKNSSSKKTSNKK
jgi:hypothetical protein